MILERIAKLIDVKSLVTLALVIVLCVMTVTGEATSELFNSAVMLVLGFFFGKNLNKQEEKPVEPTAPIIEEVPERVVADCDVYQTAPCPYLDDAIAGENSEV